MAWKTTGLLPPPGSSVSHCVSSPPHLSPPGQDTSIPNPQTLSLHSSSQVVGPKFMDVDRAWTTQKLHRKQETMKLTCLHLQGPEETRALQKEAGQEVSGCSAGEVGGLLPFPQSSSQTGAQQSNS